ncbi:MAG TPA: YbaB/EbfC family nucleoid-associated protein [Pseudonocardiaceae bacterium]|nr:YbaB/EbfC family nucleoid-associated protein [Pseudonocardiaceae bacterium]
MFDTDPDQMERRVTQWAQGFADKAAKVKAMRAQVEQIQGCASSPDGAVRVTVDSHGVLTDLVFTDKIREIRPPELAAQVMTYLRRAQQQLAPKVREVMLATVGGEQQLVDNVVSSYRERFGEDLSPPSSAADPGVLQLGAMDSPLRPGRHHRQVPAGQPDDEYFANRGYLS